MKRKYTVHAKCHKCGWSKEIHDVEDSSLSAPEMLQLEKEYPVCPECHNEEDYHFGYGVTESKLYAKLSAK